MHPYRNRLVLGNAKQQTQVMARNSTTIAAAREALAGLYSAI